MNWATVRPTSVIGGFAWLRTPNLSRAPWIQPRRPRRDSSTGRRLLLRAAVRVHDEQPLAGHREGRAVGRGRLVPVAAPHDVGQEERGLVLDPPVPAVVGVVVQRA